MVVESALIVFQRIFFGHDTFVEQHFLPNNYLAKEFVVMSQA
jgi:hypothetical protein